MRTPHRPIIAPEDCTLDMPCRDYACDRCWPPGRCVECERPIDEEALRCEAILMRGDSDARCCFCGGHRCDANPASSECAACRGRGRMGNSKECRTCQGTGRVWDQATATRLRSKHLADAYESRRVRLKLGLPPMNAEEDES